MNSIKTKKLGNLFQIEISNILLLEIKDPNIKFVTVTGCDITNDLSFAKVYITCLNEEYKDITLSSLNKASEFIEMELSKRVEIRKMPKISFLYDNSIAYGNLIEKKLEEIKNKDN